MDYLLKTIQKNDEHPLLPLQLGQQQTSQLSQGLTINNHAPSTCQEMHQAFVKLRRELAQANESFEFAKKVYEHNHKILRFAQVNSLTYNYSFVYDATMIRHAEMKQCEGRVISLSNDVLELGFKYYDLKEQDSATKMAIVEAELKEAEEMAEQARRDNEQDVQDYREAINNQKLHLKVYFDVLVNDSSFFAEQWKQIVETLHQKLKQLRLGNSQEEVRSRRELRERVDRYEEVKKKLEQAQRTTKASKEILDETTKKSQEALARGNLAEIQRLIKQEEQRERQWNQCMNEEADLRHEVQQFEQIDFFKEWPRLRVRYLENQQKMKRRLQEKKREKADKQYKQDLIEQVKNSEDIRQSIKRLILQAHSMA